MDTPSYELLDEMGKAIWRRVAWGRIEDWALVDELERRAYRRAALDAWNIIKEGDRASVQNPQDQAPPSTDCTAHKAIED